MGGDQSSDYLLRIRDRGFQEQPVEQVAVDLLTVPHTPRLAGEDPEYVQQLADCAAQLPPIIVHRATMAVVDGAHRLRAARIRDRRHIAVRFFDGDEQDAALLSVAINVAQGRPLSPADRVAAAERVFRSRPQWSDRAVAAVVGLSATKVAQIRGEVVEGDDEARFRVGRDGRARPMNAAQGRELASRLIRTNPHASLRQIARKAGIAPATVADVRNRMRRGEDPLPPRQRVLVAEKEPAPVARQPDEPAHERPVAAPVPGSRTAEHPVLLDEPPVDASSAALKKIVNTLCRDPSLRLSKSGRRLLRLFEVGGLVADNRGWLIAHAPSHCMEMIALLADGYAESWRLLAEDLRREKTTLGL